MRVPNLTASAVFRNHYLRLLVSWCPIYSDIWSYTLYGCSRAHVPGGAGRVRARSQAVLAVVAQDTTSKQTVCPTGRVGLKSWHVYLQGDGWQR